MTTQHKYDEILIKKSSPDFQDFQRINEIIR